MSRLVTIARFYDMPSATCAKSLLDACHIPCFLHNDDLVRLNWHWIHMVQGIKLHTLEEHYEDAIGLLASCQRESEIETPAETFWRQKYINGVMAFIMTLTIVPFIPFWMRKRQWSKGNSDEQD